jgi:hypothetical protein
MLRLWRSHRLDFVFVALLLSTAAFTLLVMRGHSALREPVVLFGLTLAVPATLTFLWSRLVPANISAPTNYSWMRRVIVPAALGIVTFFAFYLPVRIHFWGGGDEHINVAEVTPIESMLACDLTLNRPFTMLPALLGQSLTPGRIEGFLWLASGLCWLNGLLLYLILRELWPEARVLRAAAAVLLIVDPSDPARFFVMWASAYYWTALVFTLGGIWLYLHSYRTGSRPLLTLACMTLAVALLTSEAGYPLAAMAWLMPLVAAGFSLRRVGRRLKPAATEASVTRVSLWSLAWGGTLAILAVRFVLFLMQRGDSAYQITHVAGALRGPSSLFDNLGLHVATTMSFFECDGAIFRHWGWSFGVLVPTAILVGCAARRIPPTTRSHGVTLGVAAIAMLLGIAPFVHMSHTFRAEFFAAPGKAVLIAGVLQLLMLFSPRVGGVMVTLIASLLAANAVGQSTATQLRKRGESPVTFESTTHVFRQIHAFSPTMPPETVIVLFLDEPNASPVGFSYSALMLSKEILGVPLLVANAEEQSALPIRPIFGRNGIELPEGRSKRLWSKTATYDQVLTFRVSRDGTVQPLLRLPEAAESSKRYDPIARAVSGPIDELPYLRYPCWARRPRDLFDMADGILLGDGWGPLENVGDARFRRIREEAELVINPMGLSRREIRLRIEMDAERIDVVDPAGKLVACATGGEVRLVIPTDPARLNVVRLRVRGEARVVCPPRGK